MFEALERKKGSTTVEAAVMLPLLVSVVLGFIFFLGTIKEGMILQQAAREGAIYYARYGNPIVAVEKTKMELESGGIDPNSAEITPVTDGTMRGISVQKELIVFTGIFENLRLRKETVLEQLY